MKESRTLHRAVLFIPTSSIFLGVCLVAMSDFHLTAEAQTPPSFGVTLDVNATPADQAIVGIQNPITLSGTVTSSSPTAVIVDGIPVNGRPLPNTFVQNGGSWQLTVDTTSLVTIAQTPGFVLTNSSGLTTFGIVGVNADGTVVSYSTAYLSDFTSILVGDFGQGFSQSGPSEGDPSLALHLYIDYAAPSVTFNPSATSIISGTVTDNFQLGTLTLSIQDLTDPASSYFNEDSSGDPFNSGVPLEVDIPINHGDGVKTSPWSYDDGVLQADRVYRITLVATDSVNNVSTTTKDVSAISELNDAVAGNNPGMKSAFSILFTDANFKIQYRATATRVGAYINSPYYCASWNGGASDSNYWLKTANKMVVPEKTNDVGCDIEMKLSANMVTDKCLENDTVYVMSGTTPVGQLDGTILVPRDITYTKTDANVNLNTGPDTASKGEYWTQTVTGGDGMDLSNLDFHEELTVVKVPVIPPFTKWVYPSCGDPEPKHNFFPDTEDMKVCDPNHLTDAGGNNRFCDKFLKLNVHPEALSYFTTIGVPVAGISCATRTEQTWYVHKCAFPKNGAKIQNTVELRTPNVVTVDRSFP